jgi:hypothetical protein
MVEVVEEEVELLEIPLDMVPDDAEVDICWLAVTVVVDITLQDAPVVVGW